MTELNDNTAVFCVAEISEEVLNDFFRTAYSAPEFADEGVDDVGRYLAPKKMIHGSEDEQASSSTLRTSQPSQGQQSHRSPRKTRSPSSTRRPKKSGILPSAMYSPLSLTGLSLS